MATTWKIDADYPDDIRDDKTGRLIATMYSPIDPDERRLIEAAPKLMRALKLALAYMMFNAGLQGENHPSETAEIESLIAEVEGR